MSTSVTDIHEGVARSLAARQRLLAERPVDLIIHAIAQAALLLRDRSNPLRTWVIEQAPAWTGFSPAMVDETIEQTFGALTAPALGDLVDRELGDRRVLDGFCPRGAVQSRAICPRLITHFLAGNVPAPGINSIVCGLLLKAANLVKTSSRDPVFPRALVEALRAVDPELADCVAVFDWSRQDTELTRAALVDAQAVLAYGDDRAVSELQQFAANGTKFLGYGHRISFAVVAREAMTPEQLPALAEAAALDVSLYDQQGCLSPHVIYVEERGALGPRRFASVLAAALDAYQGRVPRGRLSVEEAARFATVRDSYLFHAASDPRIAVWASKASNDWAVIYEDNPSFTVSCLNRLVFVKPTDNLERLLEVCRRLKGQVSTVGMAPMNDRVRAFAVQLAGVGVPRICPIGQMQRPTLSWHHDGRPNLADLVRWSDLG